MEPHAHIIDWAQLNTWPSFDLIICGTNQPDYLLHPDQVNNDRHHLIFDLSLPRNVDPRLARTPHITLLNIDELNHLIQAKSPRKEIEQAKEMVRENVERQVELFNHKQASRCLAIV